jgi:hypothetical protein
MTRNPERPTVERIYRTCRDFQRHWSASERKQRMQRAQQRQRQLVEMLKQGV